MLVVYSVGRYVHLALMIFLTEQLESMGAVTTEHLNSLNRLVPLAKQNKLMIRDNDLVWRLSMEALPCHTFFVWFIALGQTNGAKFTLACLNGCTSFTMFC